MTDQVQNFKRRTADLDIQNAGLKTKLEESNTLLAKADKENSVARQKQEDLEISLADSCQQVCIVYCRMGPIESLVLIEREPFPHCFVLKYFDEIGLIINVSSSGSDSQW